MRQWRTGGRLTSDAAEPADTSRRGFLRRAGITGAVAAALAGGADAVGLSSASAATRAPRARMIKLPTGGYGIAARTASDLPDDCRCKWQCTHVGCGCSGCCPSGTCCFHCVRIRNITGKCRGNYSACLSGYGCGSVAFCGT